MGPDPPGKRPGAYDSPVKEIAVTSNTDGRQEVFGISSRNNAVWYIVQTAANGGWGTWGSLGGWVSQLVTGSTTDGRLELFGIGSNHALWIMRQTSPDNWTGSSWVSFGGYVKQIAVGRNLDGREEVFAIGKDNTVWALMEAAVDDAWTDSNWFQVTTDPVQALAVVLNTDFGASSAYGKMTLALIQSNNSLASVQQLQENGGWN